MQLITLHPVQSVTITILADNFFDGLLPDQGVAKRASLSTQKLGVTTALMEGGQTFESPIAQHGFSALVTLTVRGQTHRLLFDTGTTPDGPVPNETGMKFNPHVTIGLATQDYLKKLLEEKFEAFTFSPAGAAVYHLGNHDRVQSAGGASIPQGSP